MSNVQQSVSLRPSLALSTGLDQARFMNQVEAAVVADEQLTGSFKRGHAMIAFVESKRHFWSPWMHLEYRSDEAENVFARFSPNPSIWTGFVMAYLAMVVLTFFSIILGVSQQLAQQIPWGYYCLPAWPLISLGLWWASKIGQHLAKDEMELMKSLVERCALNETTDHPKQTSVH